MADTAPTGTITVMFTDIQDSTALWERMGDRFRPLLDRHHDVVRRLIERWEGYEVKSQGDSFMVAFHRATDAVQCAVEIERELADQEWPEEVRELLVRIGIHTGEPFLGYDASGRPDYFGPMVNRAARVAAAGHGGQILLSSVTRDIVQGALSGDLQLADLGRHRLRGLEQAERLWEVQLPDLPRHFPQLKTLNPDRHNLPHPATPFIGREREIETWCELLRRPETRLLTLLGFGGMGKTRAALQLAELCAGDFAEEFPDGVWWVDLEEARSGGEIVNRIAHQLRLALQAQPSVHEQLGNFLRERQLLLVLDNTEQVPDAAGVVADLLSAALRLKCVVTTRRALELQVERTVEVSPLPPSDAERLFEERARARKADFALNTDNAADVAELCRRLEGVPLAIELAASRIVGLTPREILGRLTERFRLLQTCSSELPPRQRALRGAIDWSYDLLSAPDKELFVQLAVFAGGFTLADAEAVCDALDVFEATMELRRQSLLRAETDTASQQTRYLMLEAVRDYATEKLRALPGDGMPVRRRHAERFLLFADHQAAQERTPSEAAALRAMEREFDNVRAALLWMRESGEGAACARLAAAMVWFLEQQGFWQAALQFAQMGLDAIHDSSPVTHTSSLLHCLQASLQHSLGNLPAARRSAEESLAAFRRLNDDAGAAQALNLLGLIARREGNPDAAQSCFEESLRLHRALGRSGRAADCLCNLGLLAGERHEPDTARRLFQESLALAHDAGDRRGIAAAKNNLGMIAFERGDLTEARRCYSDSLRVERDLGSKLGMATALHNLGEVAEREGDTDLAACCFSAAQRWFTELGSPWATYSADALTRLGRVAAAVNPQEVIETALGS